MKSIRLLPIVIFAAVALLLFKGVGLLTNGGYVLVGTTTVEAAQAKSGESGGESAASANAAIDAMASMMEPTMEDTSPTADDTAPTIKLKPDEKGHGATAEAAGGEHGAEPAAAAHGAEPAAAEGDHGASVAEAGAESEVHAEGAPAAEHAVAAGGVGVCPPESDVNADGTPVGGAAAEGHGAEPAAGGEEHAAAPCDPSLYTAEGDALPVVQGPDGTLVPFSPESGSESAVLERLGERRTELDAREQELDMRMALVEAAEKRVNERTAVLEQLEARINALVEQNNSAEVEQFKSIIAMYETMKPKEAALIFDELDMNTLLRVARAMNPRKMAPIMAKMNPVKAKDLTANMAVAPSEPQVAVTSEDLAGLPQIVGQ